MWLDFIGYGFDGRSWGLLEAATVDLTVSSSSGIIGMQLEISCGGVARYLPDQSSLYEMPFTTSWNAVLTPARRRRLHSWVPPVRRPTLRCRHPTPPPRTKMPPRRTRRRRSPGGVA